MIRYAITKAQLHAEITKTNANWFTDTAAVLAGLPANPASSDFKPLWSKIKQVYIDLQFSKCCFCEKPLEGKIEQDVEHFRPKAEVTSPQAPFTNCLRSFERMFASDPARAEQIADECLKFMNTKSIR